MPPLACMLLMLVAGRAALADDRSMPPEGEALARATATVREAFRDDLAKQKPDELQKLARKMLSLVDAEQDGAVRFAMLTEACATAMRAEDVKLSFDIVGKQAEMFRIDLPAQRCDMFFTLAKSAKDPAAHRKLVELNLALVGELMDAGDVDTAERQLRAADISIPKARDNALRGPVIEAKAQLNAFKREMQLFSIAQTRILEMPEDPEANLVAGRFLCFFKGDWSRGLPHLAKGRDAAMAATAKSDLAKPEDASAQAATAGLWWDLSEKQTGRPRDAMQLRAAFWYESAFPSLAGLAKSVAEKRLESASKIGVTGASGVDGRKPINLIADASGQRDSVTGRWSVENGEITCPTDNWARFKFNQKLDSDEFDVTIEFTRHQGNQGFGIVVKPGGKPIHFGLSALDNQYISVGDFKGEDPKNMKHVRLPIGPNGKKQQAKFQVRKGGLTIWLNGKMVLHYKTDLSDLGPQDWGIGISSIGLISWYNSITFHKVELQPVKGK